VTAARALPLPDRLLHNHWRVRSEAYADVLKETGWAQDATTQPLCDFGAHSPYMCVSTWSGAPHVALVLTAECFPCATAFTVSLSLRRGCSQGGTGRERERVGRGSGSPGRVLSESGRRLRPTVCTPRLVLSQLDETQSPLTRRTPTSHAPELAANLVAKGLTARPKTVAKAAEALLLLVALGAADTVVVRSHSTLDSSSPPCVFSDAGTHVSCVLRFYQEACVKGSAGKLPKGVAACVDVLLQALRAFGVRVVKPTPVMKCVATLVDHKDGSVRENAKEVAVRLLLLTRRTHKAATQPNTAFCGRVLSTHTWCFAHVAGGTHAVAGSSGCEARPDQQDAGSSTERGTRTHPSEHASVQQLWPMLVFYSPVTHRWLAPRRWMTPLRLSRGQRHRSRHASCAGMLPQRQLRPPRALMRAVRVQVAQQWCG